MDEEDGVLKHDLVCGPKPNSEDTIGIWHITIQEVQDPVPWQKARLTRDGLMPAITTYFLSVRLITLGKDDY